MGPLKPKVYCSSRTRVLRRGAIINEIIPVTYLKELRGYWNRGFFICYEVTDTLARLWAITKRAGLEMKMKVDREQCFRVGLAAGWLRG